MEREVEEERRIIVEAANFLIRVTPEGKTEMVDKTTGEVWEQKKRLK